MDAVKKARKKRADDLAQAVEGTGQTQDGTAASRDFLGNQRADRRKDGGVAGHEDSQWSKQSGPIRGELQQEKTQTGQDEADADHRQLAEAVDQSAANELHDHDEQTDEGKNQADFRRPETQFFGSVKRQRGVDAANHERDHERGKKEKQKRRGQMLQKRDFFLRQIPAFHLFLRLFQTEVDRGKVGASQSGRKQESGLHRDSRRQAAERRAEDETQTESHAEKAHGSSSLLFRCQIGYERDARRKDGSGSRAFHRPRQKSHPKRVGNRENQVGQHEAGGAEQQDFLATHRVRPLTQYGTDHEAHEGKRGGQQSQFKRFCAKGRDVERQNGQDDAETESHHEQGEQYGRHAGNFDNLAERHGWHIQKIILTRLISYAQ